MPDNRPPQFGGRMPKGYSHVAVLSSRKGESGNFLVIDGNQQPAPFASPGGINERDVIRAAWQHAIEAAAAPLTIDRASAIVVSENGAICADIRRHSHMLSIVVTMLVGSVSMAGIAYSAADAAAAIAG